MAAGILRVVPEDLDSSASTIDRHAADLAATHAAADARIDGALPQLPGLAAAALAVKTAEWRQATTTFTERMTGHATAMRTSADMYTKVDDDHAQRIGTVTSAIAAMLA
jgi:WXG100 family type VII secretion target